MYQALQKIIIAGVISVTVIFLLDLASQALIEKSRPQKTTLSENQTKEIQSVSAVTQPIVSQYIKIINSCGPYFTEPCVNARSGPGEEYPVISHLRTGLILKTSGRVERAGRGWYKVIFDDWIRYPERVNEDWFVSADFVDLFSEEEELFPEKNNDKPNTKRILVDRGDQILYAYDGNVLFMKESISTGLEFTPTPRGLFTVYKKTPSRYMQGPLPEISDQYYDLPGVPWNLYFTEQGGVIHGAYWHDKFGQPWSHGCVNLPPEKAEKLYRWADLGTSILVQD